MEKRAGVKVILIISVCKEKLHELEFVKPVEHILKENKISYFIKHYKKLKTGDLRNASKIIICGTSLADNEFVKDINYFRFLGEDNKPTLGICAGMQIISMVFDLDQQVANLDIKNDFSHILKSKKEIGFFTENFTKSFLGLKGPQEVYHLHNNYCLLPKDFTTFTDSEIPQAIKHNSKEIYATLFHPEVRQKELIAKFVQDG